MATGVSSNTRQLKENLANYEAQLHQVEAALTNDPDNEELLKLKADLTEVKQLTVDLIGLAPEPKRKGPSWKAGDHCQALWADNGRYYNAVIDMVSEDGENCTVTFDGYGTSVVTKLSDLRPQGLDEEDLIPESKKKKPNPARRANAKEKRAEVREYKKKKALKKKERMQEVEAFREKEKNRWQMFSQKSSKSKSGPLNGRQKKSIFAVPDSLDGRVGVGTCNIGGKGMTDFVNPSKTYSAKQS